MGATRTPNAIPDPAAAGKIVSSEGLGTPRRWANDPGDTYGSHAHPYHKVVLVLEGSITFHLKGDDVAVFAGDRLDIEPGTIHSATVGPEGVRCVEATR